MGFFISRKEYDSFSKKLSEMEKEREKLQKMLGKIMETSGSFASKTPGFNEVEGQIINLNQKIADLKNFLSQSKILKDLSELRKDEVTIYSLISALDINTNKEIKYYIQHDFSGDKNGYKIITLTSPIGQCLMGKKAGDEIEVKIPLENMRLKIINIEHLKLL